jgi:hypothetical protein
LALSAPAGAELISYTFPLDTMQETPPPTIPAGAPLPVGTGTVDYDTDTNTVSWMIHYQDLTGPITAAHFHGPALPGVSAGVQLALAGAPGQPATGMLMGSGSFSEAQEAMLLDGLLYINLHTTMNPPGEIRGQVVPEPASFALIALGACAMLRRR